MQVQEIRRNQENEQAHLESCRHSITKHEKLLRKKQAELESLTLERGRAESVLDGQEDKLRSIPLIVARRCAEFEERSNHLISRMQSMYDDLIANGYYRTQTAALQEVLEHNKSSWKAEEVSRKAHHSIVLADFEHKIRAEEHALSVLVSNLNSLKTVYAPPPVSVQWGYAGQQQHQHQHQQHGGYINMPSYPQHFQPAPLPQLPGAIPTPTPTPVPAQVLDSSSADLPSPEDTQPDYEVSGSADSSGTAARHVIPMDDSVTVSVQTLQQEVRTQTQVVHYEMSVPTWFQDIKRRRIDVYSLQEHMAADQAPR